jgi:flavin-dependent dehydrogenase
MASFLSMKGYQVTVLEREHFPREHVGESMLPFCYDIFDELGILAEVEDRFVRKPGVRFIDVNGTDNTAWCFAHHIKGPNALSFQVIRSEFDELLLDHSATLGATVHEGCRVTDVELMPEGVVVSATGPAGESWRFDARFVVDASGRNTFLSNRLKTKTAHKELERTALSCSYWKGAKFKDTLEQGLIQIVYLGGDKQGWIWCIPLGNDRLSVGVVVNTDYYLSQRAALRTSAGDWRQALYLQELQAAPFTRDILDGATMERDLMVNGDYSYVCHQKWGDRFALVGDASAFIDPIFSTGVFMAMNSSRLAADAIDVRLSDGPEKGAAAFEDAYHSIVGAYDLIDKLIRLFYTPEAINFAQLGAAGDAFSDFDHYRDAIAVYHFLIGGDFYGKSEVYSDFVESLRDPKIFKRYKRLVLDRPTLNAPSCDTPPAVAFHEGLARHEPRRERDRI